MKTMALRGGDLVVEAGGYRMVTGHSKIVQDLRGALLEPVGTDRFHPAFGSLANRFIGEIMDGSTQFRVQQEVSRVLSNYIAIQRDRIARDVVQGTKSRFTAAEIVAQVRSIDVAQNMDALSVRINLVAGDSTAVTLSTTVGI